MCKTDLEYALHPKRKSCHLLKIKKYSYVYMCAIYTQLFWSGMLYDDSWCLHNKAICFETTEPMSIVLFIVQDGLFQQICKETTILTLVERKAPENEEEGDQNQRIMKFKKVII